MKIRIQYIYAITFSLIISSIVIIPFINSKFYGFEHEDAFISSFIANSTHFDSFMNKFRTQGCDYYLEENCIIQTSYTGHYVTYSFYLFLVDKIFSLDSYKTHKYSNLILLMLWLFILFKSTNNYKKYLILTLSAFASLPLLYVANASLIENMSICFGIIFITLLKYQHKQKEIKPYILILFILILSIIKRENLFFLATLPLFMNFKDLKNWKTTATLLLLITIQIIINPFYTEILETNDLGKNTFSWEYFKIQFPVYLKSFFSIKGFLPLTIILLLVKPNRKSIPFLILFLGLVLIYSSHYRSKYVIESQEMSIFETYRYMTNTLPFLFGYFIFSEKKWLKFNNIFFIFILFFGINSTLKFQEFLEDEHYSYHSINEYIKSKYENNVFIIDNFNLISILNHPNASTIINSNVDLFRYAVQKNTSDTIVLINRFGDKRVNNLLDLFPFEIDKDFSNESVQNYLLNRNFMDSEMTPIP